MCRFEIPFQAYVSDLQVNEKVGCCLFFVCYRFVWNWEFFLFFIIIVIGK